MNNEQTTKEPRKTKPRKLSLKARRFAEEYVKTGNGTQSALKVYDTEKPEVANAIAVENLQKPSVSSYIEELLSKAISDDELLALHVRNAKQTEHLPVSQKAIESLEEIKGIKKVNVEGEKVTQNNVFIQNIQAKVSEFEDAIKAQLYVKKD